MRKSTLYYSKEIDAPSGISLKRKHTVRSTRMNPEWLKLCPFIFEQGIIEFAKGRWLSLNTLKVLYYSFLQFMKNRLCYLMMHEISVGSFHQWVYRLHTLSTAIIGHTFFMRQDK